MNKTAKIIIGVLVLVSVFFLLFAQIKTYEVQKSATESVKLKEENQKLKAEAEVQTDLARRLAADAREAQNRAEKVIIELQECRESK